MKSSATKTTALIVTCLALCIPSVTEATMVVAVKVPDGFVIATDSRLGIMTTEGYCRVSDEMQKLMQAGQKVAIAVSGGESLRIRTASHET